MRVKPAMVLGPDGEKVRAVIFYPNPPHAILPEEGGNVPDDDMYWQRRLRDGDVELVEEPHARSVPRHRETE